MKYSTLKIDGEEYRLGYDFNELCEAEGLTGCNLLAGMQGLADTGVTASQLRGMLFAALRACPYDGMPEPVALLKKCGGLIRADTIGPIMVALGESYALAVSEECAERYRAALAGSEQGPKE